MNNPGIAPIPKRPEDLSPRTSTEEGIVGIGQEKVISSPQEGATQTVLPPQPIKAPEVAVIPQKSESDTRPVEQKSQPQITSVAAEANITVLFNADAEEVAKNPGGFAQRVYDAQEGQEKNIS